MPPSPTLQATGALADSMEKASCLSLLADLALDPGCARTLFRGGAVPQMLLNAQGCTHVKSIAVGDDTAESGAAGLTSKVSTSVEGEGDFDRNNATSIGSETRRGSTSLTPSVTSPDADDGEAWSPSGGRWLEVEGTEEERELSAGTGFEICRCRQAMRLLARLVRGLPGEAPAVVLRRGGLRSTVQIVEDATAVVVAVGRLPVATEAATGEALEVRGVFAHNKTFRSFVSCTYFGARGTIEAPSVV